MSHSVLRKSAPLWVPGILLMFGSWAQAQSQVRRPVGETGVSLELPATWKVDPRPKDVELMLREYPAGDTIAIFAVQVIEAQSGLSDWVRFHKGQQLELVHPGCEIASEEDLELSGFRAHLMRIGKLKGEKEDYELIQVVVAARSRFVFTSFYFEKGRGEHYEPILRRSLDSLQVNEPSSGGTKAPDRVAEQHLSPDQIDWASDFEDAFRVARERHVPVLICFNMDGEPACQQILKSHYQDPRLVELSRKLVCLMASKFDHRSSSSDPASSACPRFGVVSCVDHRDVEILARETYLRTKTAIAPQHLLCAPDGRLLLRREWMLPKVELEAMMRKAIRTVESSPRAPTEQRDPIEAYEAAEVPEQRVRVVSDAFLSSDTKAAEKLVEKILGLHDESRLIEMIDGLGFSGHYRAGQIAMRYLEHASADVRSHAAVAIEMIGAPESVKKVEARLKKEREIDVKKNLLRALGACGRGDDSVAKLLLKFAKRGESLIRINAILALDEFHGDETVEKELIELLKREPNVDIRQVIAWTLGALHSEAALDVLKKTAELAGEGPAQNLMLSAVHKIEGTLGEDDDHSATIRRLAEDTIERVR
ncbi:MAG: HEAT repeat domain-containing protein [Planctomycetota bacterium]